MQDLEALGPEVHLIDVREPAEWEADHVSFAVPVPLATVPQNLNRFDGTPTYVICRSGGRSAHACEFADGNGHDVVNVVGGMLAWLAAGFDSASGV